MNWGELGWPADPWGKGIPYDRWRLEANLSMIEKLAAKRGQKEEPKPKRAEKKVAKGAAVFGGLFG